jgi:hypothetical protein
MERRLDGRFQRRVLSHNLSDFGMEASKAIGQGQALGKANLTAGDQLRAVGGPADDRPAGAPRSRVHPEDLPSFRQDAASDTASASNDRLA